MEVEEQLVPGTETTRESGADCAEFLAGGAPQTQLGGQDKLLSQPAANGGAGQGRPPHLHVPDAQAAPTQQQRQQQCDVAAGVRSDALRRAFQIIQAGGQQPTPQLVAVVAARLLASCQQLDEQRQQQQKQQQQQNSPSSHHSSSSFTGEGVPAPAQAQAQARQTAANGPNGATRFCRRSYPTFKVQSSHGAPSRSLQWAGSKQPSKGGAGPLAPHNLRQQQGHAAGRGRTTCQVDGCLADLPAGKDTYTGRYRVCSRHMVEAAVVLHADRPSELYRFCNQCFKFERLACFDDAKRGCRVSLARRRERQRMKKLLQQQQQQQQQPGFEASMMTRAPASGGRVSAAGWPAAAMAAAAATRNSSVELSTTQLLGELRCELMDADAAAGGGLQSAIPSSCQPAAPGLLGTAGSTNGRLPGFLTPQQSGQLLRTPSAGQQQWQAQQQWLAQQQLMTARQPSAEQSPVGWSVVAGPPVTPAQLANQHSAEMSGEQLQLQHLLLQGLASMPDMHTQTLTAAGASAAAWTLPTPAAAAAAAATQPRSSDEAASAAHACHAAAAPGVPTESAGHYSSSNSGDEEEDEEATGSQEAAEDMQVVATSACDSSSSAQHQRGRKAASRAAAARREQRRQQRRSLRPKKAPRWQHSMKIVLKRSQRTRRPPAADGDSTKPGDADAAGAAAGHPRGKRHEQGSKHTAAAAAAAAAGAAVAGVSAFAPAAQRQPSAAGPEPAGADGTNRALSSGTTWPLQLQQEELCPPSAGAPALLMHVQSLDLARLASAELLRACSSFDTQLQQQDKVSAAGGEARAAGAGPALDGAAAAAAGEPPTANKVYSAMLEELADWFTSGMEAAVTDAPMPDQPMYRAAMSGQQPIARAALAAAAEAPGSAAAAAASANLALGEQLEAVLRSCTRPPASGPGAAGNSGSCRAQQAGAGTSLAAGGGGGSAAACVGDVHLPASQPTVPAPAAITATAAAADEDETAAAAHAAQLERQLADVQLQMREMQKMLGILRAQHSSCSADAAATTTSPAKQPATRAALMGSMPEISGPQGAGWNLLC